MTIRTTAFHRGEHVDEKDLLPKVPGCPFCGSKQTKELTELQSDPQVLLMRCETCLCCSASRIPTTACLDAYYAKYYQGPKRPQDEGKVTFEQFKRFAAHLTDIFYGSDSVRQHGQKMQLKILDFGGGDGSLALAVASLALKSGAKRVEIVVVDYNPSLCKPDNPKITLSRHDDLEQLPSGEVFDLVIASAVLEHLPFPQSILFRLLSLVACDGHFYARTPYMEPIVSLAATFGKAIDFTFPGHIHDMGQPFWESVFEGNDEFNLIVSQPSLVETSVWSNPVRTIVAYALKAPWLVLGKNWRFVGGWEVGVQRVRAS